MNETPSNQDEPKTPSGEQVGSDALLALPDSVMRFRSKVEGAMLFGKPIERLDRESLIAALGCALSREETTRAEMSRRTDFLLSLKG